MTISVERKPYIVVTDEGTGCSMKGGRSFSDRSTTNEMWHASGARCTVSLGAIQRDDQPGAVVRIAGLLYLNPGEETGTTIRKLPSLGDFVSAEQLYEIVVRLCAAWHEATYTNVTPMRVLLPNKNTVFSGETMATPAQINAQAAEINARMQLLPTDPNFMSKEAGRIALFNLADQLDVGPPHGATGM